jgi:outer membrane protein assembly factor BamB
MGAAEAFAASSRSLVLALDTRASAVTDARKALAAKGLLGSRICFDQGAIADNPLASDYADLLVVYDLTNGEIPRLSVPEIVRVLTPGGRAVIGSASPAAPVDTAALIRRFTSDKRLRLETWTDAFGSWVMVEKLRPATEEDWTHWNRAADNNVMSQDRQLRLPYRVQFLEGPCFTGARVTLASDGRLFVIAGNRRGQCTITARNGYNGRALWQHPIAWSDSTQSSRLGDAIIATPDMLYVAQGAQVTRIDAATGEDRAPITFAGLSDPIKLILLSDGVLFAFDKGPQTAVAAWGTTAGRQLWSITESGFAEERMAGCRDGKLLYYVYGAYAVCRDAATGAIRWTNTSLPLLKEMDISAPVSLRYAPKGLGNAPGMVLTPALAFLRSPNSPAEVALSMDSGSVVRQFVNGINRSQMNVLWDSLESKVFAVEPTPARDKPHAVTLDPISAAVTADSAGDLTIAEGQCARITATMQQTMNGAGGGGWGTRYNRTSCETGKIVGSGRLYAISTSECRCAQLINGQLALCSADTPRVIAKGQPQRTFHPFVARFETSSADWPTYRGNSGRSAASGASVDKNAALLWHAHGLNAVTAPIAAGGRILVGDRNGSVVCLNERDGTVAWSYPTGGPQTIPPTMWNNRAYLGSSDGYLYCLESATGKMLWRYAPQTGGRRLISVFGALSSSYPVNSGAIVKDGAEFASASLLPTEGGCVFALDPKNGRTLWQTALPACQMGPSCQGSMTIAGSHLVLNTGKSEPAPSIYSLKNGSPFSPAKRTGAPFYMPGREVLNIADKWIGCGGAYLHADNGPVPTAGWGFGRTYTFSFFRTTDFERPVDVQPFCMTEISPAWDGEILVAPTYMDGETYAWEPGRFMAMLDDIRTGRAGENYEASMLYGGDNHKAARLTDELFRKATAMPNAAWGPVKGQVKALAIAANVAVCCVAPDAQVGKADSTAAWFLRGMNKQDGATQWQVPLPRRPMRDGICIDRQGAVVVVLDDGSVVRYGLRQQAAWEDRSLGDRSRQLRQGRPSPLCGSMDARAQCSGDGIGVAIQCR